MSTKVLMCDADRGTLRDNLARLRRALTYAEKREWFVLYAVFFQRIRNIQAELRRREKARQAMIEGWQRAI